jgi:hypothetical protein
VIAEALGLAKAESIESKPNSKGQRRT